MPPVYDNLPTHYSISEKNIREWFRHSKTQIVIPALDRKHDEDRFYNIVSKMLDEMTAMRN